MTYRESMLFLADDGELELLDPITIRSANRGNLGRSFGCVGHPNRGPQHHSYKPLSVR